MITALELEGIKCYIVQQVIPKTISFTRTELSAVDGVVNKSKVVSNLRPQGWGVWELKI